MTRFDHVAVEARDVDASSNFLADILGAGSPTPEGADDDMRRIDLAHGSFLLFSPATEPRFSHVAFRVDEREFRAVVARLLTRQVRFGNNHFDTSNGKTEDQLGGAGWVYFTDDNGHLWEVAC